MYHFGDQSSGWSLRCCHQNFPNTVYLAFYTLFKNFFIGCKYRLFLESQQKMVMFH